MAFQMEGHFFVQVSWNVENADSENKIKTGWNLEC